MTDRIEKLNKDALILIREHRAEVSRAELLKQKQMFQAKIDEIDGFIVELDKD